MGDATINWKGFRIILTQCGLQANRTIISEREVWGVGLSPACGSDGRVGITGGVYLSLSRTVHCNQAHYKPASGGREASGFKGGQYVVVTGKLGLGRDANGGSGGRTYEGGGGNGLGGDGDGLNRWEDTVVNLILGTDSNDPLAYALVLELHLLIVGMLRGHGGEL